MLLNRQRVKFWQKIIFGFMAVLMGGFLIFGYSGVASSCGKSTSTANSTSLVDKQIKVATATLAKTPKDPTALFNAAQAYAQRGAVATGSVPTAAQTDDLTKAIAYYTRYIALPDSALGSAAAGLRIKALRKPGPDLHRTARLQERARRLQQAAQAAAGDATPYLGIASTDVLSNDTAGAIAAFTKFLKLDPNSQYASQVKTELAQLKASASPSPSSSATP